MPKCAQQAKNLQAKLGNFNFSTLSAKLLVASTASNDPQERAILEALSHLATSEDIGLSISPMAAQEGFPSATWLGWLRAQRRQSELLNMSRQLSHGLADAFAIHGDFETRFNRFWLVNLPRNAPMLAASSGVAAVRL